MKDLVNSLASFGTYSWILLARISPDFLLISMCKDYSREMTNSISPIFGNDLNNNAELERVVKSPLLVTSNLQIPEDSNFSNITLYGLIGQIHSTISS